MSKSYTKRTQGISVGRHWHKLFRRLNRIAVRRESLISDYDDVIYTVVSEVSDPYENDAYHGQSVFEKKKKIRKGFFAEINAILNDSDIFDGWRYCHSVRSDFRNQFLESFYRIKNGICPDGKASYYKWLNTKEAKEAIKNWEGEPLDILYYLTHNGIIEKAVLLECKKEFSK